MFLVRSSSWILAIPQTNMHYYAFNLYHVTLKVDFESTLMVNRQPQQLFFFFILRTTGSAVHHCLLFFFSAFCRHRSWSFCESCGTSTKISKPRLRVGEKGGWGQKEVTQQTPQVLSLDFSFVQFFCFFEFSGF